MWDRLVKSFTTAFFRLISRIFPPTPATSPCNPRLILVFSCTGIGDALFQTGAIRNLKTAYPQARIVVCTHRKRQTIALHHPDVDEIVLYGKSPLLWLQLILRFWRQRPDQIVLLNINRDVVPLAYLINRRAVFGAVYKCKPYQFLLSHPVDVPRQGHLATRLMPVVDAAGGAPGTGEMIYVPKAEERSALESRFSDWIHTPYVIFQTGGGTTLAWRNLPVAAYVRTIHWLRERYDIKVVLTGGRENEKVASAIESACPDVINVCSKTTLEETAALLTFSKLLVSTDTGVMHLGFAVKCPTLAILHYAYPGTLVGPLDRTPGHEVVELQRKSPDPSARETMEGIPDEEIHAGIQRILAQGGIAPRPLPSPF